MMSNEHSARPALPFSRGLAWLVQSLTLLRLQSGRLLLIAVFMQVVLGLTQLPLIGIMVILCVPALSAGVLEAFEVTSQGGRPGLNLLFKPLTSGARMGQLFFMGVLVFLVGLVSVALVLSGSEDLINPEMLARIEQGDIEAIAQIDQETLGKMVLAFLVGLSISGTLSYFTIPLLWFGERKLGAALLQGLKALVVHWRPFLMLALGLFALCIPVMVLAGFLYGMASGSGLLSVIVMACIMLLILAFQMLLFGTQYCAYQDIFGAKSQGAPLPPQDDSQLVA
jgi:hypothetical protein